MKYKHVQWLVVFIVTIVVLLLLTFAGVSLSQGAPQCQTTTEFSATRGKVSRALAQPAEVSAQSADVNLQRTLVGPDEIELCDVVTFTLFITNTDTISATSVLVTDTMPSGFEPITRTASLGDIGPNQSVSCTFSFTSTCNVISGQNAATITDDQGDYYVTRKDFAVIPGAITLRKEPAVISARLGDVVTWTVYVDNTGYGRVSNVRVTDTLGSGLVYVSGITSTSYITIPAGEARSFTISARVVACSGLDNEVAASWGCDATTCQTQTAKASIDLQTAEPALDFTPPAIHIDYCTGSATYAMTVHNAGNGRAYTPAIAVDFSPLVVTAVSPGASYSGGAFHLPDIASGGNYPLTFTLSLPISPCGTVGGGSLLYQPIYYDDCNNPHYHPVLPGSWSVSGAVSSLSVSKTGPSEVYADERITYILMVNSANISGTTQITDVFQANCGYVLLDAGGGAVVTDATHITITWSTSDTSWTRTLVFSPTGGCSDICGCCAQFVQNTLTASGADCQNCPVTALDSASTPVQCEEMLSSHSKAISPISAEACTTRTVTNTYAFANSYLITPAWQGMVFTDTLSHIAYVPGSVNVQLSDGSQSCAATFTISDTNPLVIGNILPTCSITVPGATMVITYQAVVSDDFTCGGGEFYDWSYLNLGVTGNFWCAACDDGVSQEGVWVEVVEPEMSLDISGVPDIVSACGVYTPLITLSRGDVPAYDVRLRFPTNDWVILDVLGFSGVTPVFTTTDTTSYTWHYGDAFISAMTATVQLRVQRRCTAGSLVATVYYDNFCADNDSYDDTCLADSSQAPLVLSPSPIMYKFPEFIYATDDVVTWTLTAINSGAGGAYSVTLTDVLGSDLRYVTSWITSTDGSAAGVIPIASSNWVTWPNLTFLPGEKYIITFTADIIGCDDLTNQFSGALMCQGETCQTGGPKQSHVELPPTVLLNTNLAQTPVRTCYTGTITATVRNAGLLSVYTATVTETLSAGLHYIAGSTEYVTGTGATPPLNGWVSGGDPFISPDGRQLTWTYNEISALARLYPKQTVWVRIQVYVDCDFSGGFVTIRAGYRDVCGDPKVTSASSYAMTANPPRITAQKQGRNVSTGSAFSNVTYAEPGDTVEWRLVLSNTSQTPAELTVVTDVLPSNVTYVNASPAPDFQSGQVISWYVGTLTSTTWTAFITGTVDGGGCTEVDTINFMTATWGCPETGCRQQQTAQADLRTRALFDDIDVTTDIAPTTLHQCGGLITLTLANHGPPAYTVTLTNTLPAGYVYVETIYSSTTPIISPTAGVTRPVWTWKMLPTGATTVTFRVVNANSTGNCATPTGGPNVVTISYNDSDSCATTGPYTNTSSQAISVASPQLSVAKTPRTQAADAGQMIAWTLWVTNTGSSYAPNILVTDVVGSGFYNWEASNGTYPGGSNFPIIAGNVITWTPAFTLPAGGAWTAQVTATVSASGVQTDSMEASGSCIVGCIYATASYTSYVTLLRAFSKTPDVQTGTIGSIVTFTLEGRLSDEDALYQDLRITDNLASGLGYVSSVLSYTYDIDGNQGGPVQAISYTPTSAPGYLSSGNVVWRLGNISGAVQFQGVLTAVINNALSSYNGASLRNRLSMSYIDDGQYYTYQDDGYVRVVEPLLHLSKSYTTPYNCNAILLLDNFNSGVLSPAWEIPSPSTNTGWSIVSGVARNNSNAANRRVYRGDTAWTDYSFSAMISSTDTSGDIGLVFRAQATDGNYYRFVWSRSGTVGNYRLERVIGGISTTLGVTVPIRYETNRWYHIEIRAEGSRLRVYIDGTLALERTDSTWPAGRIGLYAHNQSNAQFDDVLVARLNNQGCYVGANDQIAYTLTISNQASISGYDLVITDALPTGMSLVTYTLISDDPASAVVTEPAPIPGATGVLTWGVNQLGPRVPFSATNHTALTLTVVLQVSDSITANARLDNQASLSYDNWAEDGDPVGDLYGIHIERIYSGGSHSTAAQTGNGGINKSIAFSPPPVATLGSLVTYTLAVPSQPISATLYNVLVTDALDSRFFILSVSTAGGMGASSGWSGQVVTASFASIPHDTQAYITITTRLPHEWPSADEDADAGNVITDMGQMSHATAPLTTSNQVNIDVFEPDVEIAKSVEVPRNPVGAGDAVTYTLVFGNAAGPSNSTAYNVVISDVLPAGLTYGGVVAGTPPPDSVNGTGPTTITWSLSSVDPGVSYTYRFTATVNTDIGPNLTLTNVATVWGSSLPGVISGERDGDNAHSNERYWQEDDAPITTGEPELAVTKSASSNVVEMANPLTYTLWVTNTGTVNATNVTVSDTVPMEGKFLSATPPYTGPDASRIITWSLGTLAPLESRTLTFTILVTDSVVSGTVIHNTAYAADAERDTATDDEDVLTQNTPGLDVSKNASDYQVIPGQVISYTVAITNTGTALFTSLRVTDTLPSGLSYADQAEVGGNPREPDSIAEPMLVWYDVGPLHAGRSVTITFQVTVTTFIPGFYTNTVAILAMDVNGASWHGGAAISVEVQAADVGVTKTVEPAVLLANAVLTYTITYYNAGPGLALEVYVTDTLPAGTIYGGQVYAPPGWIGPNVDGPTISWYTPTLAAGDSGMFVITATLDPLSISPDWLLTNTVVITATGDPILTNNAAYASNALQGLDITKYRPHGNVRATWSFWYYIYITNTASTPATGVVITDTLPEGLTFVQPSPGGVFDGVRTVTWTIDTLGPGWSTYVSILSRIRSTWVGRYITNTACVDSLEAGPVICSTDVAYVYSPPSEPVPTLPSTPTRTSTPTPTPTATPTMTPPGDLVLTGLVYDATIGPAQPISAATISVLTCVPRRLETVTGPDGWYSLLLPGLYLNACAEVTLEIWASGYQSLSQTVSVSDLCSYPEHNFALSCVITGMPKLTDTPTATLVPSPTCARTATFIPTFTPTLTATLSANLHWLRLPVVRKSTLRI